MTGSIDVDYPAAGVTRITLNNPGKANALSPDMAGLLLAEYRKISEDEGCGSVIVRGAGRHFCSGGDRAFLGGLSRNPLDEENYRHNDRVYRSFVEFGSLPVPTIAAVRGAAVGAGVNLMLASDVAIVSETARVISGFASLGIHPGGGHYHLVARRAGYEAAVALSVFGEELSGTDCKRLGLAWDAVPDTDVDGRALELAQRAGSDPELSRARVKSARLEAPTGAEEWSRAVEMERGVQAWSLLRGQHD